MRDPFPFAPIPALSKAVEPLADLLAFPTLPLHVHEVLGAALFYTLTHSVISPVVSNLFFSKYYPKHNRAKKANWDAHVVSLVQSVLINALALWTMFADEERKNMDFEQRVWGYTGASGMIQALACGYFIWDLGITLLNLDIFGVGLLAHAISALAVYSFGFRPYLNYYSSIFILYELSTPFLNIHWFFDKLNMTGSKPQLYNGILLLVTFFCCRLVWGTWQSVIVYGDMWRAIHEGPSAEYIKAAFSNPATANDPDVNLMYFARGAGPVPIWLAGIYVASNLTLNSLNWYWFYKMIHAVKKRFEPPKPGKKGPLPEAKATAVDSQEPVKRRRRPSIEDVVPDTEELRKGTIQ
ncbi:TRAM, LAG1 and CLN8 domain-containing protein [Thermochaetoides thermophila DSM 1495]|uniref:TRAM, LAG1 and CLN8 domain-containing protein n=1 Tax=Chaetomium thermophilum (strain DSM 1495 / CBS 144.50 / IMI 039719) TaxID=759272 RepID=G0RZK4_CHATD|nr:TRAM, LAG1 and CLN8 domain-containing protein [Thermochaetoides thermophila DSM 1495]EGS23632.1 TRAM, LAG1 and CLN8 domain-containing protein [Thermochaetoides thermophila DSM 1495]